MTLPLGHYETAEDAETAFYEALRHADLDAMMTVWADEEDTICIHPNGPRLIGTDQIRESWQSIFDNGAVTIRALQQHCTSSTRLAIHNLIEEVTIDGERGPHLVLCYATNIYVREMRGWRLICHHASPADDDEIAEPEHHGMLH